MTGRRRAAGTSIGRRELVLACAVVLGIAVVALVLAYLVPVQGQLPPLESDAVR